MENADSEKSSEYRYELFGRFPPVDMGSDWRCSCGGTTYVMYGPWYHCQHCAKRVPYTDDVSYYGLGISFSQAFAEKRKEQSQQS